MHLLVQLFDDQKIRRPHIHTHTLSLSLPSSLSHPHKSEFLGCWSSAKSNDVLCNGVCGRVAVLFLFSCFFPFTLCHGSAERKRIRSISTQWGKSTKWRYFLPFFSHLFSITLLFRFPYNTQKITLWLWHFFPISRRQQQRQIHWSRRIIRFQMVSINFVWNSPLSWKQSKGEEIVRKISKKGCTIRSTI